MRHSGAGSRDGLREAEGELGMWENGRKSSGETMGLGVCYEDTEGKEKLDRSRCIEAKPQAHRNGKWWVITPCSLLAQKSSCVYSLIHLFTHLFICSQQSFLFVFGQLLFARYCVGSVKPISPCQVLVFSSTLANICQVQFKALPIHTINALNTK